MDIKEKFYANLNMIREEAEQLDELEKETLTSYKEKATKDLASNPGKFKRRKGIDRAKDRLSGKMMIKKKYGKE